MAAAECGRPRPLPRFPRESACTAVIRISDIDSSTRPGRLVRLALVCAGTLIASACTSLAGPGTRTMPDSATTPTPPIAAVRSHLVRSPNGDRVDEYYWLRDDTRKDPEVIGYLEAENAYLARDAGAREAARGQDLRRDRRAHQAGRLQRALCEARLLVLQPVRDRQGVSDPRPQGGNAGAPEAGDARRQRARQGIRFLPGRRAEGQPGQPDPRLRRGQRRPPPVVDPLQGSRDRRDAPRPDSECRRRRSRGRPTAARCSTWKSIPRRCWATRSASMSIGTDPKDDPVVYVQDDTSFYTWVDNTKDDKYVVIHSREHGHERTALRRRRQPGRVQGASCRASAIISTMPSTSTAAGSSARTGRRRTSG